jgi:Protein of unknown function (DUF3617)
MRLASPLPQRASTRARACACTPLIAIASLASLWGFTAQAADAPPIKPGLWEVTNDSRKMDGHAMPDHSAQMAEAMKKMPPQMRQQMEARMKANGVQMAPSATGNTTVRMCLTKDMLEQNRWQQNDHNCKMDPPSRSGSTWKWKVVCPQGTGEGTTTFSSPEAYTTQMHMTMAREGGTQHTMDMTHRAKWLGADCGGVKPMAPPAAKK